MSPDDAQRQRRDPEATRGAILQAAERLFLDRGFAETPISAIAREAGVTKSLIHHHFGSKESLWAELKEERFRTYFEAQRTMLERSEGTLELLRESIQRYFRFLQADPDSVRLLAWRFAEGDASCIAEEQGLYHLGMERIREAQERGELRDDLEPLFLLKSFLALSSHWFLSKEMLRTMMGDEAQGEEADRALDEGYLETLLAVFFDGVRPRSAEDREPRR